MSVEFLWRIPVHGDGRRAHQLHTRGEWNQLNPAIQSPQRVAPQHEDQLFAYYDYVQQVAKAADIVGFHGALIPAFPHTEEPWVLASALARETKRLRLLIAIQPWFIHPAYASQMAASLQRLSQGRVEWNVISGGGGAQQRAYGDFIEHDQRYARTNEFLEFVKGYSHHAPFDYDGKFFHVEQGGLRYPMNQYDVPRLWLAGASDAALQVAGRHADIHLTWGEPVQQQKKSLNRRERFLNKTRLIVKLNLVCVLIYWHGLHKSKLFRSLNRCMKPLLLMVMHLNEKILSRLVQNVSRLWRRAIVSKTYL
jgi:alkanesulfonate monooxygenase